MPDMILPSGQYAMVAHPTEYAKRPYIFINGRWFRVSHGPQISARGITEHTVREAIQNDGYRPVFFGLKIEIPEPAAPTFTFAPTERVIIDEDAWAPLRTTLSNTEASINSMNASVNIAAEAINTYARTQADSSVQRQMEQYQRWINERGYNTPRQSSHTRGVGIDLAIADEVRTYSFGEPQSIPNPHGDDTTRRYPTSEQITARRRR